VTRHRAPLGFRFIAALVILCCRLFRWRIDAAGHDKVPDGGVVLTWNHISHVDFAVTALPLYRRTGRPVRFLALRELWESTLLGWVPRLAHCVPVERSSPSGRRAAFGGAVAALQRGDLVMVAPEGTISESFELLPFRTGPVRMAQAAGVPIVPTASWGSHRFVTSRHPMSLRRAWRLPVVVRYGEPIHVGPDDDPVAATEVLRQRTQALLEEARAAYPDDAPPGAWWVPAAMGGGAPTVDEVMARYRPGQPLTEGRWGRHHPGRRHV
jgi:1-acyl-sn-glycerol-3-phosphate acyltransferase